MNSYQRDYIRYAQRMLSRVGPGQSIQISMAEMGASTNSTSWADQVLEGIVGSAYEWRYQVVDLGKVVEFERLATPLDANTSDRTFVEPDRRQYYDYDAISGLYRRNGIEYRREKPENSLDFFRLS